uniref:Lin-54 DREAM MuvB core complex component n=1 Tax=Callithrix jacchus TaxID=9483 RepID=F6VXR0_CALJA
MEVVPAEIAKKPRTPTSGPVITKLIFAKPINSKAVTGQTTQVSPPVIAGRVLSQSTPGTPSKTITISESGVIGSTLNSTTQTPNKIAISPLKSPNKQSQLLLIQPPCGCQFQLSQLRLSNKLFQNQSIQLHR